MEMLVHKADGIDQAPWSSGDNHRGLTTSFLQPRAKGLNLHAGWAKESCLVSSRRRLLQWLMKRVLQQLRRRGGHMESTICLSYFDVHIWTRQIAHQKCSFPSVYDKSVSNGLNLHVSHQR